MSVCVCVYRHVHTHTHTVMYVYLSKVRILCFMNPGQSVFWGRVVNILVLRLLLDWFSIFFLSFFFLVVLGIKPRALHMLGSQHLYKVIWKWKCVWIPVYRYHCTASVECDSGVDELEDLLRLLEYAEICQYEYSISWRKWTQKGIDKLVGRLLPHYWLQLGKRCGDLYGLFPKSYIKCVGPVWNADH